MTEQDAPQPKLTAMQKADRALERLDVLESGTAGVASGEPSDHRLRQVEDTTAVLDSTVGGLVGALTRLVEDTAALGQQHQDMIQKVGDLEALVVAGSAQEMAQMLVGRMDDLARRLDERIENIEGWQRAELEGAQDGTTVAGLIEMVAELREQVEQLETRPVPMGVPTGSWPASAPIGAISAPHVLGLIVELKRRIGSIGKDRRVDHRGGRYDFRGVDDAMDAVGNACIEVGIVPPRATVIHTSTNTVTVEGKVYSSTVCTMRYTFQSPVDGSEWSTEGIGEGRDLADKSVTKAQAAALKYALFHGLCIPIRGMNIDAETEHLPLDGRPVDQGSHEYRQWQNAQENAEQREYERAAGAQLPPQDVQASEGRQPAPGFETAEDAAAYCRQRGDAVGTLAELNQIIDWATKRHLMAVHVDGSPLGVWLLAAAHTKPPVVTG